MLNKVYQDKLSKKMVRAIPFNGERWLYERKDAYPMVESKDSKPHQGIFGMSYEPAILTTSGEKVIEHGDFIIQDIEGNNDICKSIEFDNLYELVKWDKDNYFGDKQNEVMEIMDVNGHDKINPLNPTVELGNIALKINKEDYSIDKKEDELRNILTELGSYSCVYAADRLKDMSFLDEYPEWKERASKVLLEFTI